MYKPFSQVNPVLETYPKEALDVHWEAGKNCSLQGETVNNIHIQPQEKRYVNSVNSPTMEQHTTLKMNTLETYQHGEISETLLNKKGT